AGPILATPAPPRDWPRGVGGGRGVPADVSSVRALLLPVGQGGFLVERRRPDGLEVLELLHVTEERQIHGEIGRAGELRGRFLRRLTTARSAQPGDVGGSCLGPRLTLGCGLAAPLRRPVGDLRRTGRREVVLPETDREGEHGRRRERYRGEGEAS